MSDAKSVVEQLSRDGVSLVTIYNGKTKYSELVRVEALRVLHMNVRGVRVYDKEVSER